MSKAKETKKKDSKKVAVKTLKEKRIAKANKRREKNTDSKIVL